MRRGAFIAGHWAALVVADEGEASDPLRVVVAESFEAGRLVPTADGNAKQWEFTETDLWALVDRVVRRFLDLDVKAVVIEWATAIDSRTKEIATAVQLELAVREISATFIKKWRLWNTSEHWPWVTRRCEEGYVNWPAGTFAHARACGAMLLESIAQERPFLPPVPKPAEPLTSGQEVHHDPSRESSNAPIAATPVTAPGVPTQSATPTKLESPAVLQAAGVSYLGRERFAGIDPGSGALGLVIADRGESKRLKLVWKGTLPVGKRVPLARPRKIKRGDETVTLTTRHSLTVAMVNVLADEVVRILLEHGVTRLAIEHVESVHLDGTNTSKASSIATSLIRSSWVDLVIGERAAAAGLQVERVSASSWRAVVAGRVRGKRGGGGAELIPAAIQAGIEEWPTESDMHERDAAGVCLYLVTPPPTPAHAESRPRKGRARQPGSPNETGREKAAHAPSYYLRLERLRKETEAKRAATGCVCANRRRGRHGRDCPLATLKSKATPQEPVQGRAR